MLGTNAYTIRITGGAIAYIVGVQLDSSNMLHFLFKIIFFFNYFESKILSNHNFFL